MPANRQPFSGLASPPPQRAEETDYSLRHFQNLAAAVTLLFIAVLIAWTAGAFFQNENDRRCYDSGRKDCASLPAHPKSMRVTSR